MPLHPKIQAVLAAFPPDQAPTGTPAERRAEMTAGREETGATMYGLAAPVAEEHDMLVPSDAGGVPIRVYRPGPGTLPAYVFVHGGGWWLGTLDESDGTCRRRAADADCVVISVDYRLAPEHPFPAAVDDAWAAVRWVVAHAGELDIDPSRVAIGGMSAGGNIAAAVTLLAREDPVVRFATQILEVPVLDLTLATCVASADEFATGYGFTRTDLVECVEFYLGGQDPNDVLASPLLADLHDLPAALITTAEYDPIRDDGEAYAAKLAEAGVPATLRRWDGQVHGTMEADVVVPEVAAEYRALIADFLRRHL
jgi:acetyl esterase/lipase